ncbi:MAG TPA: AmmeMemoRadiSam system protein B [Bellilinea sp.]|nr:AmmeMemoRadiSam system protein B [Bellilinea sp.]
MNTITEVRPSPIAGRWYAGDPVTLAREIDTYLNDASLPSLEGEVLALIAPHAGHRYSGRTAAHAFKAVTGQSYDQVVVVSPLHGYHPAALLTSAHQKYATPLGEIPVDRGAVEALRLTLAEDGIALEAVAYDDEHSLEIELPFLQRTLAAPFNLLPVMVRSRDWKTLHALGKALAEIALPKATLLVASSDLSHFYPESTAKLLDREMLARMISLNPESVLAAETEGAGFACGAAAIAAVIIAALELGANHAQLLHHSTSADETGDSASVVGYGSVVILKRV